MTSKAYESIPEAVRPAKDAVYKLLENPAYDLARKAANATNRAIGTALDLSKDGLEVHEIIPVKFGGNPLDGANKVVLHWIEHDRLHIDVWNVLQKALER